jgi:hypothetical protein
VTGCDCKQKQGDMPDLMLCQAGESLRLGITINRNNFLLFVFHIGFFFYVLLAYWNPGFRYSYAAEFALSNAPWIYSPSPAIFKTRSQDYFIKTNVTTYWNNGVATKVLIEKKSDDVNSIMRLIPSILREQFDVKEYNAKSVGDHYFINGGFSREDKDIISRPNDLSVSLSLSKIELPNYIGKPRILGEIIFENKSEKYFEIGNDAKVVVEITTIKNSNRLYLHNILPRLSTIVAPKSTEILPIAIKPWILESYVKKLGPLTMSISVVDSNNVASKPYVLSIK